MAESTFKPFVLAALILAASMLYTKIKTDTLDVDGTRFIFAGMAQQTVEGNVIYVPVYRKVQK